MEHNPSESMTGKIVAIIFIASAIALQLSLVVFRPEINRQRALVGWLFARDLIRQADTVNQELLSSRPEDPWGLLFAGEIATRTLNEIEAPQYFKKVIPFADPLVLQHAYYRLGQGQYQEGNLFEAERLLKESLKLNARDLKTNKLLSIILYTEGRGWEALPYLQNTVMHGDFLADELCMLASTESWVNVDKHLNEISSGQGLLELGKARIEMLKNQHAEAVNRLKPVLVEHPDLGEAQGAYGQALLSLGKSDEFELWKLNVLQRSVEHPEIFYALAVAAHAKGNRPEAIRHYVEVLKRHPFHRAATYQLSQQLFQLGHTSLRDHFIERSKNITEIHTLAGELQLAYDARQAERICEILLDMERNAEACGWASLFQRFEPHSKWCSRVIKLAKLRQLSTRTDIPELDSINRLAIKSPSMISTPPQQNAELPQQTELDLIENAQQLGISFNYDIDKDINSGMEHIFETTGGGAGVVDFDSDGLMDLYLAQACDWKLPNDSSNSDALFRNLGGKAFEDISTSSGIQEFQFSQGVTVGDLNEDGMQDIYVCNLGENSCFINNGDGTFTESALALGVSSNVWSLSAAIADVNGDHLADLYVVNYLNRDEVAERSCKHEGQPRSCAPTMFSGEQDRLFLNDGHGAFIDITDESGIIQKDGKGLGILVADFFGDAIPEIYVGNDTVANFLFVLKGTKDGIPMFENEAVLRGLAFNSSGQVQATMGMATADVNGDQLLDIFATNFYQDANTLYLQSADHFFQEQTRQSNLYDAGFDMLGFGTQFVDIDRSGRQAIVITNGHVDRMFATGEPDFMPPQVFRDTGNAVFEELSAEELGGYFTEKMLGRGLAVWDWNNDGRLDLVVTHLDRPVAVITNQTISQNHYLALTLVGTRSARIPIGAKVELTLNDDSTLHRQLTTGDGYEVRNDPRLFFGLAQREVKAIQIEWPSGNKEQFTIDPLDTAVMIIEGQGVYELAP